MAGGCSVRCVPKLEVKYPVLSSRMLNRHGLAGNPLPVQWRTTHRTWPEDGYMAVIKSTLVQKEVHYG